MASGQHECILQETSYNVIICWIAQKHLSIILSERVPSAYLQLNSDKYQKLFDNPLTVLKR